MIDFDAFGEASAVTVPFRHAEIRRPISEEDTRRLLGDMPANGFFRSSRSSGSDKTYRMINNVLFTFEEQAPSPRLPTPWRELVDDLTGDAYVNAVSHLLGTPFGGCPREITLKRYHRGDYISMHTDSAAVRGTHLLFLNRQWRDSWGGRLCFHHENGEIYRSFSPILDSTVLFARSGSSWHSVTAVETEEVERVVVQVVFWNSRTRQVAPGRREERVHA